MMMMAQPESLKVENADRRQRISETFKSCTAVSSSEDHGQPMDGKKVETAISSTSSTSTDPHDDKILKEDESDDFPGTEESTIGAHGRNIEIDETEELDEIVNYSINPNSLSTPSPSSPAGSLKSNGCGGGVNSATRRIFTPEFKQRVLNAFTNDPECIGNQRATARKFDIHRRQVQKWLQQLTGIEDEYKDQNSSDDQQEQKFHYQEQAENSSYYSDSTIQPLKHSNNKRKRKNNNTSSSVNKSSKMPIVAGRSSIISQVSPVSTSSSNNISPSTLLNMSKTHIGNIHHPIFSSNNSNLLMGLASPLLNGSLGSNLDRHSPRHSPQDKHKNSSPSNGNTRMLDLVDELCYLYPSEDFSLLRRAMMKNEVTFTKLSTPLRRHALPENPTSASSSSKSPGNDYITQQTLQMIKNQNEYLQLLQSGYFSQDLGGLAESNSKYSSWLNPFAAAAVAGFNVPVIGKGTNGGTENNRKKNNDQYSFASPKAPVSTSKSKTVAAVLAATRNTNGGNIPGLLSFEKPKRPSQRRKPSNGRLGKSSTATYSQNEEDFIDPTSMLEVVTTKPLTYTNNNDMISNYQGMDLSSTAPSVIIQRNTNPITTMSTMRSKAMNKDYGFLNELGLVRRESPPHNDQNGLMISNTASLEHFVQNVLPQRRSSTPTNSNSTSNSPPLTDSSESSDRTKNMVLEAYNFDSELTGDARGVARKFGLNIRVVQKWIREAPTRSVPSSESQTNGSVTMGYPMRNILNEIGIRYDGIEDIENPSNVSAPKLTNGPSVNKRKNPKPNQICDFTKDVEGNDNDPLDMVVPIKKRRVSTPTSTSA